MYSTIYTVDTQNIFYYRNTIQIKNSQHLVNSMVNIFNTSRIYMFNIIYSKTPETSL